MTNELKQGRKRMEEMYNNNRAVSLKWMLKNEIIEKCVGVELRNNKN